MFLGLPKAITSAFRPVYLFLLNKWYFDELYDDLIFVRPARYLGYHLWKTGDGDLIDGIGPDGISAGTLKLARQAGRLQSGYVYPLRLCHAGRRGGDHHRYLVLGTG